MFAEAVALVGAVFANDKHLTYIHNYITSRQPVIFCTSNTKIVTMAVENRTALRWEELFNKYVLF